MGTEQPPGGITPNVEVWRERLKLLVTDTDDSGVLFIPTPLLGLAAASTADDTEAMSVLGKWIRSGSPQLAVRQLPVAAIAASLQGVVRLDVLLFYLGQPSVPFDGSPSPWGASGPLGVRLVDGRIVLVDGTHRLMAAILLGSESLCMQVL